MWASHYGVFCVYRWCHKLLAVKLISAREMQPLVCEIPSSTTNWDNTFRDGVLGLKSWNYRTDELVMKFYLILDAWLSDHFQRWSLALCFPFLPHFIWCKVSFLKMPVHAHTSSYHFWFLCQRTRVMSQYIPIWCVFIFLSCVLIISTALSYQLVKH